MRIVVPGKTICEVLIQKIFEAKTVFYDTEINISLMGGDRS
jgi:hypothetical protein